MNISNPIPKRISNPTTKTSLWFCNLEDLKHEFGFDENPKCVSISIIQIE